MKTIWVDENTGYKPGNVVGHLQILDKIRRICESGRSDDYIHQALTV